MRNIGIFLMGLRLVTSGVNAADHSPVIDSYLNENFPARIEHVEVGIKEITVTGTTNQVAELTTIPIERSTSEPSVGAVIKTEIPVGPFSIKVPREERLTDRWQLCADGKPISHAHYADEIISRDPQLPPAQLRSKKGLGGWHANRIPGELEALGIASITVNVKIDTLVSLKPDAGTFPITWNGHTYYAKEVTLASYDQTFSEAEKHGIMVSAILLVGNPARESNDVVRLLGHPDATKEGFFAMPNLTSTEGVALYGAILNLMAERWSKPGSPHGRVHQWIMHNEVDAGQEWTNAGEKSAIEYMDLYHRSMRMMDLIARQYDPNACVLISLTHHWANPGKKEWYGSKALLELLLRYEKVEGEFPWGLAYHPYPQSLLNPRTWEDHQATLSPETEKITPKNLEVLDAYMKQPRLLYRGKVRPVHLSENGFNSKDYTDSVLAEQAAGMAYAWKKITHLSSIKAWEYHNLSDNRGEFGLRIGLRKFPDEPGDPLGKKPIWYLYQALGTEREDAVSAPYLKVIGIASWNEIPH